MPELGPLRDLIVIFGLGALAVVALHRLRLPPVVGLLLTGVVTGPHGFGLIENVHEVEAMAEIGVVLLLFSVGLEFSLERLAPLKRFLFVGGGLQVMVTIAAAALLVRFRGQSWQASVFFGMLVSLSSTAVVMRLLGDRGEIDGPVGGVSLGILIFQDLCVVPMMLLVPMLAGEDSGAGEILWATARAVLVVVITIFAARKVVPLLLRLVVRTRSSEAFLLTIILLCLGTAWTTAQFGLSLALGAFIAGIVVSESPYSQQALGDILPFQLVFNSLFFVSVGMLFDVRTLLAAPVSIALILLTIMAVKTVVTAGVVTLLGQPVRIAVAAGLGLAQVGEFSFVLSRVGLGAGLLDADLNQVFLAASVLTMTITPLLIASGPFVGALVSRALPGLAGERRTLPKFATPGAELANHVIVIGYGLSGRNLTRVLANVGIPFVVVETNSQTVLAERKKNVPILYGDAAHEEVLHHAGIARARVVVIAISDAAASRRVAAGCRHANRDAHIVVRSRYVRDMPALLGLGASEVVPEEFETSIEIFALVLRRYLVPRDVIDRCVSEVRQGHYEMLRALDSRASSTEDLHSFLGGLAVEAVRVPDSSPLAGSTLAASDLKRRTGATVVAIQRADGELVGNPRSAETIGAGATLLLIGREDEIAAAAALLRGGGGGAANERR